MTTKTKAFYLVTVFTPIKDGNHYCASSKLFYTYEEALNYAAKFEDGDWITEITERHLPQH